MPDHNNFAPIIYPFLFPSYAPHGRTPLGFPLTIPDYEKELIARDLDAIYTIPINCEIDHVVAFSKKNVVLEFFRRQFDRNFIPPKLPQKRGVRDYRKLLKAEVDLLIHAYKCLSYICPTYIEMRPSRALLELSYEVNSLIFPHFFIKDGYEGGATTLLKEIQKHNGLLFNRENPFRKGTFNWRVVQKMIEMSEQRKRFSPDFYTPIVKARGKLAQLIKASHPEVFVKDPETQKTFIPIRRGGNTTQHKKKA
jgi:hypothetical protein